MKLDVYIPTYKPHFKYLNKVVDMYLNSTEKPDNIVISVSDYKDMDKILFDEILCLFKNSLCDP